MNASFGTCAGRDRPGAGRQHLCRDECADARQVHAVHHRHLCQRRPERRAAGRDHATGRGGSAPLRPAAQSGDAVALHVRFIEPALRQEDARRARPRRPRARPAAGSWRSRRS